MQKNQNQQRMRRVLTKKHEGFIRKNYLKFSSREIGKKLGDIPRGTIMSFLKIKKLKVPRKIALQFKNRARQKRYDSIIHPEDKLIKKLYLTVPVKKLANRLGRSHTFVDERIKKMNLKIPREIIEQRKKDSRIKPGHIPMNKGRKQIDYMTPEAIEKTVPTRFQKGNLPHNAIGFKDGDIQVRRGHRDRNERPYKWKRISLGKWKMLHVYNWEKKHGPVPKCYIIVFRNGDTMNCSLKNLKKITLAENMRRNTIHRYPPEVKSSIRLLSKMNKKIINASKQIK